MKEEKTKQSFTISRLIIGHMQGVLTTKQQQQFNDWIDADETNKAFFEEVTSKHNFAHYRKEFKAVDSDYALAQVKDKIHDARVSRPLWKRTFMRAAAILVVLSVGMGIYLMNKDTDNTPNYKSDVSPGGNRATLTLADGSTIDLSDEQEGIIIDNSTIKYTDGGFVIQSESAPERQLALTTPKGGQYQITLPDGTKVWLNAESSLKYPSRFSGKERHVQLTGEAYFEVTPDSKQPFIVSSANQEVTVLGTHFNISAYTDENETKTTLMEGSVKVASAGERATDALSRTLNPGQQAILTKDKHTLTVKPVNTGIALAWTKGNFQFESESIEQVMKKIARWYDVTIEYRGPKPTMLYNGFTPRGANVSEILSILEKTGSVRFEIEGRRIVVMQ